MGKQRAIKLKLNRKFLEKRFKYDRNILQDGKNKVKFEPACVFTEEKPRWQFWKKTRELIIFVDGALKALMFKKSEGGIAPFWTQKDMKKLVKVQMKRSLAEEKMIKTWQFFIIMGGIIANLILLILLIQRMGPVF